MSYEPEDYGRPPETGGARGKVVVPGVLLIIAGAVNVFGALYLVAMGAWWALKPVDQVAKEQEQGQEIVKQMLPVLPQQQTPEQLKITEAVGNLVWGALAGLAALPLVFGGIQMCRLRSYGLAIFASILALVPCISCSGCCVLGQVAGIWALVVLANPDVRSAFP